MAPAALVFDLDGTVWDSYPWYASVLHQLGAMSVDDAVATLMSGSNIMRMLQDARIPIATFLEVGAAETNHLALYEGVPEVLRQLASRRLPMALISGLSASLAQPMLAKAGLSEFFRLSEFAAPKASPNPYTRVARSLDVPISATAYVGDMPKDGVGASRAGMPFWWASYGYSRTTPAGTARILRAFEDVLLS